MEIRWLNEASRSFLEKDYLLPGQTVQNRIQVIGDAAERILKAQTKDQEDCEYLNGFSQKLQSYIARGWISLSTPIWANFGTDRGLPISCFGSCIGDSVESILDTVAEIGTMSKYGGGTSAYFGNIRGAGSVVKNNGISNGTPPFVELFQATSNVMNQGSVRRGYFSAYNDIFHSDIERWLNFRGEGDPIQHITWGVNVPTWWLQQMRDGDVDKRRIWARVIQKRFETGLPYIYFTDNANNGESVPECYRGKGLMKASQMCTEIMLPSDIENSFVCDLASANDLYFDEYKETDCIEVITFLLDAAMSEFIEKASKIKHLERAVRFAIGHRALGIGRLGYHTLLQSKMIAFESLHARNINIEIQKYIQEKSLEASTTLAEMFGECKWTKGTGRRNTTLQAIAPTTSSAFIMQVSQEIEALLSNYYIKDLAKGKYIIKNIYLEKLLEAKEKNTEEVWESIKINHGSILHLDFLSNEEKFVFKTAKEISQEEVIIQAAQRQKYIDQGQSLNLFISVDKTAKEVNNLMLKAHDMGIKSLYYQHNSSAVANLTKDLTCISCE